MKYNINYHAISKEELETAKETILKYRRKEVDRYIFKIMKLIHFFQIKSHVLHVLILFTSKNPILVEKFY